MTESFGELRSLLAQPATRGSWRALCELMDTQPEHYLREALIPYTERALRTWPTALRVASQSWVLRLCLGRPPATWPLVRALRLAGLSIPGGRDAEALAHHDALASVKHLDIISPNSAAMTLLDTLPHSALSHALDTLHISDWCASPERLVSALARADLTHLRVLELPHTRLDIHALIFLLEALPMEHLTTLDLRHNSLDDRAALALATFPFKQLTHLNLSGNRITNEGARALMSAPSLQRLRTLALRQNRLGQQLEPLLSMPSPMAMGSRIKS